MAGPRSPAFHVSTLAHFIACENGWRGTAYVYEAGQARPREVVYDPSLCATREEACAVVRARALARIDEISAGNGEPTRRLDEEACIPSPCPEK